MTNQYFHVHCLNGEYQGSVIGLEGAEAIANSANRAEGLVSGLGRTYHVKDDSGRVVSTQERDFWLHLKGFGGLAEVFIVDDLEVFDETREVRQ